MAAKKGKQYRNTKDGLELLHLETDDSQVLTTKDITTSQASSIAAGSALADAIDKIVTDMKTSLGTLSTGKLESVTFAGTALTKSGTNASITKDAAAAALSLADYMLKSGGNFSGDVTFSSGKYLSVNTPTSNSHAATKKYVDDAIASVKQFKYVVSTDAATTPSGIKWYSGTTLITGVLTASSSTEYMVYLVPCSHTSGGTAKGYDEYLTVLNGSAYNWELLGNTADIDLSPFVKKDGSVAMTGNLNIGGNSITNASSITSTSLSTTTATIGDTKITSGKIEGIKTSSITADTDAVNKEYVDSSIPEAAPKLDHSVTFKVTGDVTGSATASNLSGTEVSITTEIVAGKVGTTELATNAVTTDKIKDSNVTDAKLDATGVSAGTYSAVTVNAKGRVTAGAQSVQYTTTEPTSAPTDLAVGGTLYYVY